MVSGLRRLEIGGRGLEGRPWGSWRGWGRAGEKVERLRKRIEKKLLTRKKRNSLVCASLGPVFEDLASAASPFKPPGLKLCMHKASIHIYMPTKFQGLGLSLWPVMKVRFQTL